MNHLATTPRIRRPGLRLLAVLTAAALLMFPGMGRAAAVGDVGAAVPSGVWPLQPAPTVVHGFDPPAAPWGAGHRGVDLAGDVGQAVHAALGGTVTFAGVLAGRGVVVVDHGDTRSTYEPVAASVAVGDEVAAGTVLGTLTLAQSHCLPVACLHWGLIRNADDVYLDPLQLLGLGARVRLLSLWRATPAPPQVSAPVSARRGTVLGATLASRLPYAGWRPPITRWLPP